MSHTPDPRRDGQREQSIVLPKEWLVDAASRSRIDEGWKRLEESLESLGEPKTALDLAPRRSPSWAFAIAATLIGFALGWQLRGADSPPQLTATNDRNDQRRVERQQQNLRDDTSAGQPTTSPASPLPAAAEATPPAPTTQPQRPSNRSSRTDRNASGGHEAWMTACDEGDYARAVELFRAAAHRSPGQTFSPAQLMCLSSGNETKGQSKAAIAVLERVIRDHADDPYAVVAASNLARIHQAAGESERARHYRQLAQRLSKGSLLSEASLCNKIEEAFQAGVVEQFKRLSAQYQTQFPNGPCSEKIRERLREQERIEERKAREEAKRADAEREASASHEGGAAPKPNAEAEASPADPGSDDDPYDDPSEEVSPQPNSDGASIAPPSPEAPAPATP